MDFDHIEGEKIIDIGSAVGKKITIAKLERELAKCQVVCSNCHRVRTKVREMMRQSVETIETENSG